MADSCLRASAAIEVEEARRSSGHTHGSSARQLQVHHLDLLDRMICPKENGVPANDDHLNGTANLVSFNVVASSKRIVGQVFQPTREAKLLLPPTRPEQSEDLRRNENAVGWHQLFPLVPNSFLHPSRFTQFDGV